MKLAEYRETFYVFSGKASDLNRQLGFAGIALIWIFKTGVDDKIAIPTALQWAGILIVISLALDMFHYCVGAAIWRCFYRRLETKGVTEDEDITHSQYLELPILGLFMFKVAAMMVGYFFIFDYLLGRLKSS